MLGFRQLLPFSSTSGTVNRICPVYTCQLFLERLAVAPTICISDWNMESSLPINPFVKRRKKKRKSEISQDLWGFIWLLSLLPSLLCVCGGTKTWPGHFWIPQGPIQNQQSAASQIRGALASCVRKPACCLPVLCLASNLDSVPHFTEQLKKRKEKKKALEKKKTSVAVSLSFSSCAFKLPSTQPRTAWSLDCN